MESLKLVRSNSAGVFFGTVIEQSDRVVVMTNARRVWFWAGAATLSELAQRGTSKPEQCKFPCAVSQATIFDVCEILDMTDEASSSLSSVPVWTA